MPLPARVDIPRFVVLHSQEQEVLYNVLRTPLVCMVFNLLVLHSDFKTGEILTNYPRLEELCRPPSREKGGRAKGASTRQIRYAIDQLIEYGLVKRNAQANTNQGILRLFIRKRKTEPKK